MIPVQIRFTRKIIERIDDLIDNGIYSNRSEAIRDDTRRLVIDFSQKGVKSKRE
jgi:Arc/MetJ-type ribon-helix-helix transcriptional regulator